MNISEKVPSLQLCKKLWELGITKGGKTGNMWYRVYRREKPCWEVLNKNVFTNSNDPEFYDYEEIPAPDLSELLELLPKGAWSVRERPNNKVIMTVYAEYFRPKLFGDLSIESDSLCDAMAKMLIKLNK
jgi:hypothetical protein